jgi:hypothetical protein
MKTIIYILLVISAILCPRQIFAIVGHPAPITTQTIITNAAQKSKFVAKQKTSMPSSGKKFLAVTILSVVTFLIGLIFLNWWLILLGAIGISLILLFIYLLSHGAWR